MPCHHSTSSCHVIMPHQHAMSSYHIIMPFSMACHHATSSCHVSMPHYHAMSLECTFWVPRGSLREYHLALQPKFSLLGPNFKMQYLLHPDSVWHTVCTVGIGLTRYSTWYYFCCNMMILKIGIFRSSQIIPPHSEGFWSPKDSCRYAHLLLASLVQAQTTSNFMIFALWKLFLIRVHNLQHLSAYSDTTWSDPGGEPKKSSNPLETIGTNRIFFLTLLQVNMSII